MSGDPTLQSNPSFNKPLIAGQYGRLVIGDFKQYHSAIATVLMKDWRAGCNRYLDALAEEFDALLPSYWDNYMRANNYVQIGKGSMTLIVLFPYKDSRRIEEITSIFIRNLSELVIPINGKVFIMRPVAFGKFETWEDLGSLADIENGMPISYEYGTGEDSIAGIVAMPESAAAGQWYQVIAKTGTANYTQMTELYEVSPSGDTIGPLNNFWVVEAF